MKREPKLRFPEIISQLRKNSASLQKNTQFNEYCSQRKQGKLNKASNQIISDKRSVNRINDDKYQEYCQKLPLGYDLQATNKQLPK